MEWKQGCLKSDDFWRVASAMHVIGNAMMRPALGGFDENGVSYFAVDLLYEPEDIKNAIQVVQEFMGVK